MSVHNVFSLLHPSILNQITIISEHVVTLLSKCGFSSLCSHTWLKGLQCLQMPFHNSYTCMVSLMCVPTPKCMYVMPCSAAKSSRQWVFAMYHNSYVNQGFSLVYILLILKEFKEYQTNSQLAAEAALIPIWYLL